jgi:hypothetical protein
MEKAKNKLVNGFIISTFVGLYLIVSVISTIHVIEFFELSNPKWLAISLALAFEVGAAASLSSLIVLDKMNKFLVWILFIVLTCMQAMGNTYYAYTHIHDFQSWSELFGLVDDDLIYQKRLLSIISGAILPLVSLGFIKSLVDYIRPEDKKDEVPESDLIEPSLESGSKEDPSEISDILNTEQIEEAQEAPVENPIIEQIEQPVEVVQSINRGKTGYIPQDLNPTKIK